MAENKQTQNRERHFLHVAQVKVSYGYDYLNKERRPQIYSVRTGKDFDFKFAKAVFKKLIAQIEEKSLVELRLPNDDVTFVYSSSDVDFNLKRISEIYDVYILKEDIPKIHTESVHITCIGENYPDEISDFIKIFEAVSR